jgi:hypothetical protein
MKQSLNNPYKNSIVRNEVWETEISSTFQVPSTFSIFIAISALLTFSLFLSPTKIQEE